MGNIKHQLFMLLHAYNKYKMLHTWANLTEMSYNIRLSFFGKFLSGIQKANVFIKCFTLHTYEQQYDNQTIQISSISLTSMTSDSLISRSTKVCNFGRSVV